MHEFKIMKTINSSHLRLIGAALLTLALSSCGSYETVSSPNGPQSVPSLKGVRGVSGKPNLHVPARLGILTSSRFDASSITDKELKSLQQSGITSIIPINTYAGDSHRYQMTDLMYQRAQIIDNTKFLNLDLILLCDQSSSKDTQQHLPPLQYLSLGIVNPESTKANVQLDAVLMDARTGFIYGTIGDAGKSTAVSLTFLEAEAAADAGQRRASSRAKQQLITRFPAFWESVKKQYKK